MSKANTKEVLQDFGSLTDVRIGLSTETRAHSVRALNRLLAHTMAIRDAYKKAHWQVSGATFHQLHLLFDQHYNEQVAIMDTIAERVQTLGGVTFALAQDVVEESTISRNAPRGRARLQPQHHHRAAGPAGPVPLRDPEHYPRHGRREARSDGCGAEGAQARPAGGPVHRGQRGNVPPAHGG